jgi:hypothetical protein
VREADHAAGTKARAGEGDAGCVSVSPACLPPLLRARSDHVTLLCSYNQEDETGNIIKSMKREIHKMVAAAAFVACFSRLLTCVDAQELRHVALMQEQEDLVVEVERCIGKRESISMKVRLTPPPLPPPPYPSFHF